MAEKDKFKYITIDLKNVERVWEEDWLCFVKMKNNDIYICPQYTKDSNLWGFPLSRTAQKISVVVPSKTSMLFSLPFIKKYEGENLDG